MKRFILKFLLLALIATVYFGCKKSETFSDVPAIEFRALTSAKDASGKDTTTIITISFTDGDGDIGYFSGGNGSIFDSTWSTYYNDFVVTFFEKQNGIWVKDTVHVPPTYPGYSARLPYLTPKGNNKALKGEISMTQYVKYGILYRTQNDTIRYEVFIYDRSLNKSNTITTSEIVISI